MKSKITIILIGLIYLSSNLMAQAEFYDVMPDITTCKEGTLKDSEKQKVLNLVNKVRTIHGLKPVTYNYSKDIYVQKSALLSAANETLDHTPPTNSKCYSADGSTGSGNSNLHIGWFYGSTWPTTESSISSWIIDENVDVCGHRRWLIDPFLKFIAIGRVDGASVQNPQFSVTGMSIYVIDAEKQNLSDWQSDFVAYPYQNYPSNMVYTKDNKSWYFSFTAVFDKSNYWNNQKVSYSNATIEIKNEQNQIVPTSGVFSDNDGAGIPNILKWKIPTVQKEIKYTVNIKNVDLNGTKKDYTYWFKITDQAGQTPNAPTLILPANAAKSINPGLANFTWDPATDADTYTIQISRDNLFANIVDERADLATPVFTASLLPESTLLYWRVAGKNQYGIGSWSEVRSFTTKAIPPQKPILTEPNDLQTSISLTPDLKWDIISGATSYHVQLSGNDKFGSYTLINQENILKNSYLVPKGYLQNNTKYYWHVRGKNAVGYGEFSDPSSFITLDMTSVDLLNETTQILSVYPNPAQDMVLCRINSRGISSKLQILSESGQIIETYSLTNPGEQLLTVNLSSYVSGSYFMRFIDASREILKKIQIIR